MIVAPAATLSVTGFFTTTGTVVLAIDGADQGKVTVGGNLDLGGTVDVIKISGGAAPSANVYTLFTWSTIYNGLTPWPAFFFGTGGVAVYSSFPPAPGATQWQITRVLPPPQAGAGTVNTNKNTLVALLKPAWKFKDPPATHLYAVEIMSLPSAGTLKDNGTAVTVNQFINVSDIDNGYITYDPPTNATGLPETTFGYKVEDDQGTAYGRSDLEIATSTMTINVQGATWANTAPTGANNTLTTVENTSLPLGLSDFGFSDTTDSNNFLAVKITGLSGLNGTLTDDGTTISNGDFVATEDIGAGLVVYTPPTNSGGSAYDSFLAQVQDDGGVANGGSDLDATARTITINVTMVNQAPIGTDGSITTDENTGYVLSAGDFGFTDPNQTSPDSFYGVVIGALPAGALTNNGTPVSAGDFVSASDIAANYLVYTPPTDVSGSGLDAVQFCVRDNGGTTGGGIDTDVMPRSLTVDVTWVNQGCTGADNTIVIEESMPYVYAAGDFLYDDAPGNLENPCALAAVKVTSLPSAGTLYNNGSAVSVNDVISVSDINAGYLVYVPPSTGSGLSFDSWNFKCQNDGGTANSGVDLDATARTMTVDVTALPYITSQIFTAPVSGTFYCVCIGQGGSGDSAGGAGGSFAGSTFTLSANDTVTMTINELANSGTSEFGAYALAMGGGAASGSTPGLYGASNYGDVTYHGGSGDTDGMGGGGGGGSAGDSGDGANASGGTGGAGGSGSIFVGQSGGNTGYAGGTYGGGGGSGQSGGMGAIWIYFLHF